MPILPQFTGGTVGTPITNTPLLPDDPAAGQTFALGRAGERLGAVLGEAVRKKQALEDEAMVMQRYMGAVDDLNKIHDTLTVPENAIRGKEIFDKSFAELQPKLFDGLSANAQASLQHKLFPKVTEFRVNASKIENRARIQQYDATMVSARNVFADAASRRLGPDDASATEEYKNFAEMVDTGVKAGLMTPEDGAKQKDTALKQGAFSRAYKVTVSENPEELKHQLDLFKQETTDPGSTYLSHLEPDKRTQLEQTTKARAEHLRAEGLRQEREAQRDTEQMNADLSKATVTLAAQKLDNPEKFGPLTRDWVELAGDLRLLSGDEFTRLRRQAEERAASGTAETGGFGNPAVLNRFATDVYTTTTPEQAVRVQTDLKAAMARGDVPSGPGSIGSQYLNHLEEKVKVAGGGDLTSDKKTTMVRSMIHEALRVTGPMQQLNPQAQAVLTEALERIDKNAVQGYPEDPWDIYQKNIDAWQARIGIPARQRANELRRSMGLPVFSKDGKLNAEVIEERRLDWQKKFQEAPPGPEGDAIRANILEVAKSLKRLQELEQQIQKYVTTSAESKAANITQKPTNPGAGAAPLIGPRR